MRNKYDVDELLEADFDIKQLKQALRYVKKYVWMLIGVLGLGILSSAVSLISPQLIVRLTDVYIPNKDTAGLFRIAVIYAGILIVTTLCNAFRSYLTTNAGQRIVSDMRRDIFSHLQKLPFTYYDSRPQGKILVRVVNYTASISSFLTTGLVDLILDVFSMIVIVVFMYRLNWQLATVTLIGAPVIAATILILKPKQRHAKRIYNNKAANYHAYMDESIVGVRITQIFSREDFNRNILHDLATACTKSWNKHFRYNILVAVLIETFSVFFSCALYFVAALLITNGNISVGVLLAMTSYTGRFWNPLISLGNIYSDLVEVGAYLERIFETINEPVDIDSKPDAIVKEMTGEVTFRNVDFGYEEGQKVLKNVSFTAKPGERIALVGPTGAGKSTIVNLISRFYDVTGGEVLIDGVDVRDYDLHSLRSQMGIMLQESFLFSGSIGENIRYGNLDATQEEIEAAAKAVRAHDFIMNAEHGYDTEVEERGQSLSAGQRQLISFARTLVSHPKILILDEATSTIDTQTERYLQDGIRALMEGRTSFIIAHRLSTIRDCDRIMFIDGGEIKEVGSHDELIAKKGAYYHLYTSQLPENSK